MSVFLISICGDELRATPKIITFLSIPLSPTEKNPLSNSIPYTEYLYVLMSEFLVNVTASNKQFSSVG